MRIGSLILFVFLLADTCFTQGIKYGGGVTIPPSTRYLPMIRTAIANKRAFSLPGFKATEIRADQIVDANNILLRLSHVSLTTGDLSVEAEEVEYNWVTLEAKLIGTTKAFPLPRR
jgi:hypothetical protein